MDANEAAAWKKWTATTTHQWVVDPVHSKPDDLLVHIGGEAGKFAQVRGAVVEVGSYEGAVPHIGEASFRVQGRKELPSNEAALRFLLERGGVAVLQAFVLGRSA